MRQSTHSASDLCRILMGCLAELNPMLSELQFGLTLILYRPEQHQVLEMFRHTVVLKSAVVLQSMFRMIKDCHLAKRCSIVRNQLREATNAGGIEDLKTAIQNAESEKIGRPHG